MNQGDDTNSFDPTTMPDSVRPLKVETAPIHRGVQEKSYESRLSANTGTISEGLDHNGRKVSAGQFTDQSVVDVNGMQTSLAAAKRAGLVEQDADGSYSLTARATGRDRQAPPQKAVDYLRANPDTAQQFDQWYGQGASERALQGQDQDDGGEDTLDDASEALVTEVVQSTDVQDVQTLIGQATTGADFSQETINKIASERGEEPEKTAEQASKVRQAFEAQARETIKSQGVDDNEFLAWAYSERPDQMAQAIRSHTMERSTKGYQQLAQEFAKSGNRGDVSADDLVNAELPEGVTASRAKDGEVVFKLPSGMEVTYSHALKRGWLTVERV